MLFWIPLLVLIAQAEFRSGSPAAPVGPPVRITSPLGRSGTSGSIRIVAQIQPQPDAVLGPVQFFVDGQLLQTDVDGAPYEDLRRRYVVGYTSTNGERNGQWRKVDIRLTAVPQVTVRSSGGYSAPER
jgi:hypothetical protein